MQPVTVSRVPLVMPTDNCLHLSFAGISESGVREKNQDAFAVYHGDSSAVLTHKGVVACVADGVSCSQHGQQASQMCVTQFIQDYLSTPDGWGAKKSASRVLNSLNCWLNHHSQQSELRHNGFVSTFSAVVFKSNKLHIFHVGDSRIYRYRQGKLVQLTRDHCHRRMGDKGFLTRALGMDTHLEVDYLSYEVQKGDIYLLSTDGVHDSLSVEEISAVLVNMGSFERAASRLANLAKSKGSADNLTALLMHVDSLPFSDTQELAAQFGQQVIPPVMQVGNNIDQFEIMKVQYSGSRSHIYLVKRRQTNDEQSQNGKSLAGTSHDTLFDDKQTYVLKVPSLSYSDDADHLNAFIREQWVGHRTRHASLMRIFPSSSHFLYHLCEYVPGQTLRQWMYDNPNPDLTQVRELVGGMVTAVRALQRLGIIHRDLKPENFIITPDNIVVLIDYGAAQADGLAELASGSDEFPLGAAGYIAPEYLRHSEASHQSDIFSIGVIVYEMLTGKLPYKLCNSLYLGAQRGHKWDYTSSLRHRQDIPLWLDNALENACHADVKLRYQSMSEFVADLNTPNQQSVEKARSAPLLERDPLQFWRILSVVLAIALLLQLLV